MYGTMKKEHDSKEVCTEKQHDWPSTLYIWISNKICKIVWNKAFCSCLFNFCVYLWATLMSPLRTKHVSVDIMCLKKTNLKTIVCLQSFPFLYILLIYTFDHNEWLFFITVHGLTTMPFMLLKNVLYRNFSTGKTRANLPKFTSAIVILWLTLIAWIQLSTWQVQLVAEI